jgi:DNA (cytosine-5)-methyltransferase 1
MRLLDLFCGAGGAAMGYFRAGFTEIIGVDLRPQPRYPFDFFRGDALQFLNLHGHRFDAIHASPPCQSYSVMKHHQTPGKEHPMLVGAVRRSLERYGKPFVIENVVGAPLAKSSTLFGEHGVELCGSMFGLPLFRHRLFETSFPVTNVPVCRHDFVPLNPYNTQSRIKAGLRFGSGAAYQKAMGLDWMVDFKREGTLAVPPAYTEFIGKQMIDHVTMATRGRSWES